MNDTYYVELQRFRLESGLVRTRVRLFDKNDYSDEACYYETVSVE